MELIVSLADARFCYPSATNDALAKTNLQVKPGEFVGLVGPNGAGKTTLMSLIASLIQPTSGTIHFHNTKTHGGDPRTWIAIAPQEIAVYLPLTARENLKFFAGIGQVPKREIAERVEWCLSFVGLADNADRAVHQFSGGMKRRLNLAVALVAKPRLLLLDEPTVAVDPQSRQLILRALNHLNEEGTSIIYSSHYLEEVERFCQRLIVLDNGRVIYDGRVADFRTAENHSFEERFMQLTGSELRDEVSRA